MLIGSILFYSWGAPRFIFVILGTTLLDFLLVASMSKSSDERTRKWLMITSVCMNLGLLFYFKYFNFFIDNLSNAALIFGLRPIELAKIILPIGISFYTFESLTYVIDVYRKTHEPLKKFQDYLLYIILFPKLIAGPIIRYCEIADQLNNRDAAETTDNRVLGFFRFVIGLSKKVFIANTMAVFADEAFNMPVEKITAAIAWTGVLAYTFQIYFDFSGYSDMAIGLGRIFGFRFPENFDSPYTSRSITEFWRRWHMTLGAWMKNYLYIPLGGNRSGSKFRIYFNLWLVFLASGLWHGASWTFVIWGIYHGTFLVLDRIFLSHLLKRTGKVISTLITFFLIAIGWVFFRAESLSHACAMIRHLFTMDYRIPPGYFNDQFLFYLVLAVFFSFFTSFGFGQRIQFKVFDPKAGLGRMIVYSVISFALFTLAVASVAATDFNPFIYFRF